MSGLFPADLEARATRVLESCRRRGLTLVTAESCTGGLIAGLLTEIPGSSDVLGCGFVTYADAAKVGLVGVRPSTLDSDGAVSERTAREMAEGALAATGAGVAVAVTGVAGPGGGSEAKPVGTVHIAVALEGSPTLHARQGFMGDRTQIRLKSVAAALALLERGLGEAVAA
ncbi:MAG: CinA family protein [Geminicoccaceae bacterium]|nr:CinA family protein [Geminicoccaceae bacterium]